MRTSLQKEQRQLGVVLLPHHQPVGLYVALPLAVLVARQLVRAVFHGKCASSSEQSDCVENQLQVKASLLTSLQVFLETFGVVDAIHGCCGVC